MWTVVSSVRCRAEVKDQSEALARFDNSKKKFVATDQIEMHLVELHRDSIVTPTKHTL